MATGCYIKFQFYPYLAEVDTPDPDPLAERTAPVAYTVSFNGRAGDIVPAAGDYTSTQITNLSSVTGASVTAALNTINTTVYGVKSANSVFAGPTSGGAATPAFRALVNADIPTGITRTKLADGTANHVLINSALGVISSEAQLAISRGGTGAATTSANFFFVGPTTGVAAAPSFRAMVAADLGTTLEPTFAVVNTPVVKATTSAGLQLQASNGAVCVTFGSGGGCQAVFGDGATFAGLVNVTNASGVQTQAASTQDAIRMIGRAGGTGTYVLTLTPTTLDNSYTATFPAASIVVAGSSAALTSGRLPRVTTGGLLQDTDVSIGAADGVITRAGALTLKTTNSTDLVLGANNVDWWTLDRGTGGLASSVAATTHRTIRINTQAGVSDFYIGVESDTAGAVFTGSEARENLFYTSGSFYVTASKIRFAIGTVEKMRLTSGGALLIASLIPVGSETFRNNGSTVLGDISIGAADGVITRSGGLQLPANVGIGTAVDTQYNVYSNQTYADQTTNKMAIRCNQTMSTSTGNSAYINRCISSLLSLAPASGQSFTSTLVTTPQAAISGQVFNIGAGTVAAAVAGDFYAGHSTGASGTTTTTESNALRATANRIGGGTITTWKGLHLSENGTSATITNYWGLYENLGTGAKNYLKNQLLIGTTAPVGSEIARFAGGTRATATATDVTIGDGIVSIGKAANFVAYAGSTTSGDLWSDSTLLAMKSYTSGIAGTMTRNLFCQTASVTVANTVTETTLVGAGTGTNTLPANFLVAGRCMEVHFSGFYSTKATAAGTLRIRVKYGTTVILDTGAHTMDNGETNEMWRVRACLTCRTTGATGTIIGQSVFEHTAIVAAAGRMEVAPMVNTTAVTIDTTASSAITITAEWSTADAGNTITMTCFSLEAKNG